MNNNIYNNEITSSNQTSSIVTLMVCGYIFLFIERPWESISYLHGIPIERWYAVLMLVVAFLHHKLIIVSTPTNKWVYGLLLLHFLLAPFAFSPSFAVDQGIEYAKMVALYVLMLAVADDEATLKTLLKAFLLTMIIYSLHSLWEYSNGRHVWRMGISRMIGVDETFSDPNAFSASLVLSLPIAYVLARFESTKWLRRLYYGYVPMVVLCVVLTGSRSGFVALFFAALLWVVTQKEKRKLKILAVAVSTVILVWSVMPGEKQNRIRTLWDEDAGPSNARVSAEGRMEGWKASWAMFKQNPLTGVGSGGRNFIGYRLDHGIDESPLQAHILYGEVLAELGIAGAMCLAGLVVSICGCCVKVRRTLAACGAAESFLSSLGGAIIACLLLLLLLGLGGHNFYRPLWLWLAAWAGSIRLLAATRFHEDE